jgi:hypothetical protein
MTTRPNSPSSMKGAGAEQRFEIRTLHDVFRTVPPSEHIDEMKPHRFVATKDQDIIQAADDDRRCGLREGRSGFAAQKFVEGRLFDVYRCRKE